MTSSSSIENIQSTRKLSILCDSGIGNLKDVDNIYSMLLPNFGGIENTSDHNFSSSSSHDSIFRSAELLAKSSYFTKTSPSAYDQNPIFDRESCSANEVLMANYCVDSNHDSAVHPCATFPGQTLFLPFPSTLFREPSDQTSRHQTLNQKSDGIHQKLRTRESCMRSSISVVLKSVERVKKHTCPVCGKGFKDSYDLKRHKRTHSGVRPYRCTHCNKSFSQRCSLEKHEKTKHGKEAPKNRCKTYACEDCGHSTPDARDYYKHLLTYHPSNPTIDKIHDRRFFKFQVGFAPQDDQW